MTAQGITAAPDRTKDLLIYLARLHREEMAALQEMLACPRVAVALEAAGMTLDRVMAALKQPGVGSDTMVALSLNAGAMALLVTAARAGLAVGAVQHLRSEQLARSAKLN